MTYAPTFGTYSIPGTVYVEQLPANRITPASKLPRAHGSRQIYGYLEGKKFGIKGGFANPTSLRDDLDALRAALGQDPCNFATDSDRFYRMCQASNYADTYEGSWFGRLVTFSFEIMTGDPFAYSTTLNTTDIIASSGAVVVGGNAPAAPVLSLTMGTTGTANMLIINNSTNESFSLIGAVTSGDVIVIDSLLKTVTRGGVDAIALFDGLFPSLLGGATNNVTYAITTGTVTAASCAWRDRWYG